MMERDNFSKDLTRKRIKGLIEEFIGGRKRITPNHILGQVRDAIRHHILDIEECKQLIDEIRREIETNELFPTISKEEKRLRLKLIKDYLMRQDWWR